MTYGQSSGKHEISQKWKMKIFIVLVGKNKKRHNCRITGKTKATRYGGPSTQATRYPQRMSIANNAAFVAGGQILSGIFSLLPALGNGYLYRLFLHKTGLLFLMKSSSKKHSVDALGNSLVEGWGFIPHFRLRSSSTTALVMVTPALWPCDAGGV
ncbi:hypothetical protein ED769_24515 [Escherichia coli]|nr:hypothetical protein [Escherichia coli]